MPASANPAREPKQSRIILQFICYSSLVLFHLLLFRGFRSGELEGRNLMFLAALAALFIFPIFISLWTREFHVAFSALAIWSCVGFLQLSASSWVMEANISLAKWIVFFGVAGLSLIVLLFRGKTSFRLKRPLLVQITLGAFLFYLFVSAGLSTYPRVSFVRTLGFLAMAFLGYVFIPRHAGTKEGAEQFFKTLFWATNAVVFMSALSWVGILPNYPHTQAVIGYHEDISRFKGLFVNPNGLGPWLNLAAVMNLFFLSRKEWRFKFVSALFLPLSFFFLFYCNSRANYIGLAIAILVFVIFSRKRWLWVLFGFFLAGFVVFYDAYYSEPIIDLDWKFHLRLESRFGATSGRIEEWQALLETSEDNPWHGVGLGARESFLEERYGPLAENAKSRVLFDNSYLNFLYETGWTGLVLFLAWIGASLWAIGRNRARSPDPHVRVSSAIAMALSLDILAVCVFESFLGTVGNIFSLVLWIAFGLMTTTLPRSGSLRGTSASGTSGIRTA